MTVLQEKKETITTENKTKKVLIFSLTYHPFIGGAEVAVREITSRLPNMEFHMITLRIDRNLPKFEKIDNVNVYRIGFTSILRRAQFPPSFPLSLNKYLFPFLAFFKAMTLNFKNHYDVTWAIMANYAGFAALFFKFFYPRIPYILTLQEGDPIAHIKKRVKFIHPLFRRIFLRADAIQAISNYLAGFAVDMGYKKEIHIIPNGVDIARFSKKFSTYELESLKKEMGKRPESLGSDDGSIPYQPADVFLITTSRLVKKNGVMDIVKSLQLLPAHIKLLILGDGPEMRPIRIFARNNNIIDRIHFFSFVPHEDVPKYLQISDIFIRPSFSEGFGNSFVEAMAVGLPVIATPVGGIVDFLFDPTQNPDKPSTGCFCEVGNPQSIAKVVKMLLNDFVLCKKITLNAKKMVYEKYDWNMIALNMGKVLMRHSSDRL